MKCLVTGGAGFIGSNLVDKLIKDGHEVVIVDNMSTGKPENVNPNARFILGDIADVDKNWNEIFNGVDVVFHTAALARVQPSIDNPQEFDKVNVGGTLNMLKVFFFDLKFFWSALIIAVCARSGRAG